MGDIMRAVDVVRSIKDGVLTINVLVDAFAEVRADERKRIMGYRFYIRLGKRRGEGAYVKTYAGGDVTTTRRRSHALWWGDRELVRRMVRAMGSNARVTKRRVATAPQGGDK